MSIYGMYCQGRNASPATVADISQKSSRKGCYESTTFFYWCLSEKKGKVFGATMLALVYKCGCVSFQTTRVCAFTINTLQFAKCD
jgi:hypothetical protein